MDKVLFSEKQRGSRNKLLVLIPVVAVCVSILLGYWFIRIKYNGNPLTIDSFSGLNFIVFGVIVLMILLMVIVSNSIVILTTKIYRDYIVISYSPLKRKLRRIKSCDIISYKIRNYKAYREYLGYGIKDSRIRGTAYTVSGKIGLQLYLKNGAKLLIGTQKKQAIEYAMEKLMNIEKLSGGK